MKTFVLSLAHVFPGYFPGLLLDGIGHLILELSGAFPICLCQGVALENCL